MPGEPLNLIFRIEDYDLSLLPIDAELLKSDRQMLEEAVADAYAEQFKKLGGEASIAIANGVVTVRWLPESDVDQIVERAGRLLSKGDYATGVPILRSLLAKHPGHLGLLYNLGMALGDKGETGDALVLLTRLVGIAPEDAHAWTALGLAQARSGDTAAAIKSFGRSLAINPDEGHAHRNLGGILINSSPADALPHLRRAVELMPDDQASRYGHGFALLRTGSERDADAELAKAIEMNPLSPVAEQARSARREIAHANMRSAGSHGLRADVVFYLLAALRLFKQEPEKLKPVTFEITVLGRRGLDINNAEKKYTLNSLPGDFSGMQLVSYMYVGLSSLAPGHDPGIDLSAEYAEALRMLNGESP